ncbi:SpoIIE family protein phosphatase (plasmid) [Embleya sp. NBC_00888]|uniref:SpoIIE family protein phosphatase n=1 Tax=Embleya sp. NBC_00888 TaxID=2975960 RepID=UPI002F90B3AB|nr:SpoIIE family protein phosphatase [Embleya sp. NBC_00888]
MHKDVDPADDEFDVGGLLGADSRLSVAARLRLFHRVLEETSAPIGILDPHLRHVYVNPALARIDGRPAHEHVGRDLAEGFPGLEVPRDVLRAVLADGIAREATVTGVSTVAGARQTRWWHAAYHRLDDENGVFGVVGILMETTASRRTQLALDQAHRRLALLDRAALEIGTTLDTDTTCRELVDLLVPVLADVVGVELLEPADPDQEVGRPRPEPDTVRLRRAAWTSIPRLRYLSAVLGGPGEHIDYQPGADVARVVLTGCTVVDNRPSDEALRATAPDASRVAVYRAAGMHSAMMVPLIARGETIGTLSLVRAGDSSPFTQDDVEMARDLAYRAATCVDNARRYSREHSVALALQRALLARPKAPHPDIELATRYLPAGRSVEVGGDWFDAIALPHGRTLLAVGDVMGHGVQAAVDMSHYRALLRVLAAGGLSPEEILTRADRMGEEAGLERVATCLLVLKDPHAGVSTYANAGHLPPLLVAADGATRLLDLPTGPPLGTGCGGYAAQVRPDAPGSVLVLYTDGLVERRDEDIDVSLERLAALRIEPGAPLESLVDTILDRLVVPPVEDDVAVMAARQVGGGGETAATSRGGAAVSGGGGKPPAGAGPLRRPA